MTPRVSRRRMFVSALMASSLFAVTACTSAGSRPVSYTHLTLPTNREV